MSFTKIVFSKQADHDHDHAPTWLRWYREVFKADEILITPVKTPASCIDQTVEFYRAAGCRVQPIDQPAGWHDGLIWRRQLKMVQEILPAPPFLIVCADADQFLEPPTALPEGQDAIAFRRLHLVAEGPSRLGFLGKRSFMGRHVGGYVNSLSTRLIRTTGHHWSRPPRGQVCPLEFHLHWRGLAAFKRKVQAMSFDPTSRPGQGAHWKGWLAILQTEGEAGLEKVYREQVAEFLFERRWPPELRGALERLKQFLYGETAE